MSAKPQAIVGFGASGDFFNALAIARATGLECLVEKLVEKPLYSISAPSRGELFLYNDISGVFLPTSIPPLDDPTPIYFHPRQNNSSEKAHFHVTVQMPDARINESIDAQDFLVAFQSNFPEEITPNCQHPLPGKIAIASSVPSRVSEELLTRAWKEPIPPLESWGSQLDSLVNSKKHVLTLLLGYEPAINYRQLGLSISALASAIDASLLVTISPRLPTTQLRAFDAGLFDEPTTPPPAYIHGFGVSLRNHQENPYFAFLHCADAILVTADSMSMLADACATTKPVGVITPQFTTVETPVGDLLSQISPYYNPQAVQIRYFHNQRRLLLPYQIPGHLDESYQPINSAPAIAGAVLGEYAKKFPETPPHSMLTLSELRKTADLTNAPASPCP